MCSLGVRATDRSRSVATARRLSGLLTPPSTAATILRTSVLAVSHSRRTRVVMASSGEVERARLTVCDRARTYGPVSRRTAPSLGVGDGATWRGALIAPVPVLSRLSAAWASIGGALQERLVLVGAWAKGEPTGPAAWDNGTRPAHQTTTPDSTSTAHPAPTKRLTVRTSALRVVTEFATALLHHPCAQLPFVGPGD